MFHGHFAENRGFLRQIADAEAGAFVNGQVAQFLAVQHYTACIGGNQADYHVKAGSLTRAVGTEQADDFAAFDFKGEAFDDLAFFETFLQVLNHKTAVVCAHILLTFDIDLRPSEPFSDGLFVCFLICFSACWTAG